MAYRSHAIAASDESATEGPISTLRETVRIYVVQLDNTVERDAKILVSDVLRAHERPEQGDRVEDDARDAEVDVLVRPRREAAVGAGAHDTLFDARVDAALPEEWKKEVYALQAILCLGGTGSR